MKKCASIFFFLELVLKLCLAVVVDLIGIAGPLVLDSQSDSSTLNPLQIMI